MSIPDIVVVHGIIKGDAHFLSSPLISWTIILDNLWTSKTVDYWRKDGGINNYYDKRRTYLCGH